MKKTVLIVTPFVTLLFAMLVSCSQEDCFENINESCEEQISPSSFYVDYETALMTALDFIHEQESKKSRHILCDDVKSHYEISTNNIFHLKTRSTKTVSDTTDVRFHVINFDDNSGFAIVSADSRTTPVYAYSDEGNLNLEDAMENTGFSEFMESAERYYRKEISASTKSPTPFVLL